jgi:predicted PhzF superfamily epimerase YddE/YHI9
VLTYQPDFNEIARIDARGLILTAPADRAGVDYVCRFFGPQVGVPEDSVTGSAHCGLNPLWSERLGKTALRGYQASPRGGFVETELLGERVHLRGAAFTVIEGELCL